VAVELNCFPSRLDLPLPLLHEAVRAGSRAGASAHGRGSS
jgi:hypothetical protein